VSRVVIIVVIPTNSSVSFTSSVIFVRNICPFPSSIFEKISAIYQIDFELRYFNQEKLKTSFLEVKSQIALYTAVKVLSAFVSSSSQLNSKTITQPTLFFLMSIGVFIIIKLNNIKLILIYFIKNCKFNCKKSFSR